MCVRTDSPRHCGRDFPEIPTFSISIHIQATEKNVVRQWCFCRSRNGKSTFRIPIQPTIGSVRVIYGIFLSTKYTFTRNTGAHSSSMLRNLNLEASKRISELSSMHIQKVVAAKVKRNRNWRLFSHQSNNETGTCLESFPSPAEYAQVGRREQLFSPPRSQL